MRQNTIKLSRWLIWSSLLFLLVLLPNGVAFAQVDLTGLWAPVGYRPDSPDMGDFTGFPFSKAGQQRAETWAANIFEIAQNVCRPYPLEDPFGPAQLRIWKDVNNTTQDVTSYHMHFFYHEEERTIWMDGRPHPSDYALHTWAGFSTGAWQGSDLIITSTHLKETFAWPNGPERSDRTTVRTHVVRYGNYLTMVAIVYDPAYLAQPMVRTATWVYDPNLVMNPYPCEQATETLVQPGEFPNYMPGKNPFLSYFAAKYQIPQEGTLGGPETMYPEYIKKLQTMKAPPRPAPAAADSAR